MGWKKQLAEASKHHVARILRRPRMKSMSAPLHFDGFYYSGPATSEDWHAGVRMHRIRFHYTRYYANGDWLRCYRDNEFDFWDFTESVTPELFADAKKDLAPRIADADPLCTAGSYAIDGDVVTEVFAPAWTGGQTWVSRYKILDDRLLPLASDEPDGVLLFQPKPIT